MGREGGARGLGALGAPRVRERREAGRRRRKEEGKEKRKREKKMKEKKKGERERERERFAAATAAGRARAPVGRDARDKGEQGDGTTMDSDVGIGFSGDREIGRKR